MFIFPGKVDYIGSSHQWWHFLVVLALYYWHNTGILYIEYRMNHGCVQDLRLWCCEIIAQYVHYYYYYYYYIIKLFFFFTLNRMQFYDLRWSTVISVFRALCRKVSVIKLRNSSKTRFFSCCFLSAHFRFAYELSSVQSKLTSFHVSSSYK